MRGRLLRLAGATVGASIPDPSRFGLDVIFPAAMGGLALIRTGDRVRIDLNQGRADILIDDAELQRRRAELEAAGGFAFPASQTPWQEIQRAHVGQMGTGMVLENAVKYQKIDQTMGIPRDNH